MPARTHNRIRVLSLSLVIGPGPEAGEMQLDAVAETDLPGDDRFIKQRAIFTPFRRMRPKLQDEVLRQAETALERIGWRVAWENHFDDPATLALNGITPEMVELWRQDGELPNFEARPA